MRYYRGTQLLAVGVMAWTAACGDSAKSTGPGSSTSWQTNWSLFIDAYNSCTRSSGCDYGKFADQTVTWQGVFVDATTSSGLDQIRVTVPPKSLVDKDGQVLSGTIPPQPLTDLTVYCDAGQKSSWQGVSAGTTVTFRGRTRSGSPIAYTTIGSNKFIVYYLNGCARI